MLHCHRFMPTMLAALCLILLSERTALAYIDPGSGSLIYQAILAALLGVGFTFRRVLSALKRVGRRAEAPLTPPSGSPRAEPDDARD